MDDESNDESYETPMTSSLSSPRKSTLFEQEYPSFNLPYLNLDGVEDEDIDEESPKSSTSELELSSLNLMKANSRQGLEEKLSLHSTASIEELESDGDLEAKTNTENELVSFEQDDREVTPLGPASPAKCCLQFPFPLQSSLAPSTTARLSHRYPSALLKHYERNATPRQRRLMARGVHCSDRYIPSRASTPTKDGLFVPRPVPTLIWSANSTAVQADQQDPFAPSAPRSARMLEQYATIRRPTRIPRPFGMIGSRVRDASPSSLRAASAGAIWTVGGSIVTEGVASVTNGRGGRVTSGTSAPHYIADFLRTDPATDEDSKHGRRLAVALNLGTHTSALNQKLADAKVGSDACTWQNGQWEYGVGANSRMRRPNNDKGIPTIPFRVLDAPALRDDFYCSLLAYSNTAECLAVGLGPHVYLWSEVRRKTALPDSLTAPSGSAYVTSMSFSSEEGGGAILAVGRADGRITLWSPLDRDPRFDSQQPAPVSCVSFRPSTVERQSLRDPHAKVATEELLVGDELGGVYYYSVEWPDQDQRDLFDWHGSMTLLARLNCHSQQICGITWTPDGNFFATGGNDNQLFLFESKGILQRPSVSPSSPIPAVCVRDGGSAPGRSTSSGQAEVLAIGLGEHTHLFTLNAAVKALAFAPWQDTLLAAGGGSNDRCVHFFHTRSGATLATIDCHAQVTSLVWSSGRKEIAATFGFAQPEHPYRVAVFAWPDCGMVVGIPWWGEERALFAVPYPKGPSSRHSYRGSRARTTHGTSRGDTEGQPWYRKRTSREGCLVVATSDASIKFHEIWAEKRRPTKVDGMAGVLGGSQILEGACSPEVERVGTIR